MNRLIDIIAKALSIVLYPLFIPTYGIALFCYAFSIHVEPLSIVWTVIAIAGTLLLTCILPLSAILIMVKRGEVSDIQIASAEERTIPYLYTTLGFGFWSYLIIAILKAPLYIDFISIGAVAAIAIVAFINRRWKISAHLTGMGGLFGGIMTYCLGIGAIPTVGTLCFWLLLNLILMYARLRLNAHTGAQVCAGWLLGTACTFLPYMIYIYAS